MPFKSEAQRKLMYAKHPEIAKRWEKIHKSPAYKKMRRGKKMNSVGGFAEAAKRRLGNMSSPTPPGLRKVKPMASGRSVPMPQAPTSPGTRKAQPFKPGSSPNKIPAFQAAARRKLATK